MMVVHQWWILSIKVILSLLTALLSVLLIPLPFTIFYPSHDRSLADVTRCHFSSHCQCLFSLSTSRCHIEGWAEWWHPKSMSHLSVFQSPTHQNIPLPPSHPIAQSLGLSYIYKHINGILQCVYWVGIAVEDETYSGIVSRQLDTLKQRLAEDARLSLDIEKVGDECIHRVMWNRYNVEGRKNMWDAVMYHKQTTTTILQWKIREWMRGEKREREQADRSEDIWNREEIQCKKWGMCWSSHTWVSEREHCEVCSALSRHTNIPVVKYISKEAENEVGFVREVTADEMEVRATERYDDVCIRRRDHKKNTKE